MTEDNSSKGSIESTKESEKPQKRSITTDRRGLLKTGTLAGLVAVLGSGLSGPAAAKGRGHGRGNSDIRRFSTYVAYPGEVQSKLDAARDDNGGVVRLVSGEVYDPEETWHIWDEVALDYNGGRVELTSDINLHRFYPRGKVINQDVDLRNVGGYSSAVNWALNAEDIPGVIPISAFDNAEARPWEKFPDGKRLVNIDGGRIVGSWEEGTGILLENRIPQGLHFFQANLAMRRIHTGVRLARGRDAFQINGNLFNLHLDSYTIGVHQQYNPDYNNSLEYPPIDATIDLDYTLINGNKYNLSTQTGLILDKPTEWLWKIGEGAKNILTPEPQNWDLSVYEDSNGDGRSDGWLIESNFSDNNLGDRNRGNVLIDNRSLSPSFVVDETARSEGGPTNGVVSWFDLMRPNQPEGSGATVAGTNATNDGDNSDTGAEQQEGSGK